MYLVLALLLVLFSNVAFAQESKINNAPQAEEITGRLVAFLIPAVLGFTSSVLLDIYKKRTEKKKRLSYNIDYSNKVEVIKITEGDEARHELNVISVLFLLENSGDQDIKEQYIRLKSPDGTKILDVKYEPQPEREMGFEQIDTDLNPNEVAYNINYIKPNQKVGVRLLIENPNNIPINLKHFHKSNADDVIFDSQISSKLKDENEIIRRLMTLCLFFIIVPIPFEIPIKLGGKVFLLLEGSFEVQFTIQST